jgi:hypothetical protein
VTSATYAHHCHSVISTTQNAHSREAIEYKEADCLKGPHIPLPALPLELTGPQTWQYTFIQLHFLQVNSTLCGNILSDFQEDISATSMMSRDISNKKRL